MSEMNVFAFADEASPFIDEQQIIKADFARKLGVTAQYVHLLTDNAKARPDSMGPPLSS